MEMEVLMPDDLQTMVGHVMPKDDWYWVVNAMLAASNRMTRDGKPEAADRLQRIAAEIMESTGDHCAAESWHAAIARRAAATPPT
jgi:uncharacterized Zn finger protein